MNNLLPALTRALQASTTPIGAAELFQLSEIRAHVLNISRLSDELDGLWRKGLLTRTLPDSDAMGGATWGYRWKERTELPREPNEGFRVLADRPAALIAERDGVITVEMQRLVISIPKKPPVFGYLEGLKNGLSD